MKTNQKKALITGILGQDGPYLARLLLQKGYKVYGLIRRYSKTHFENLDYLGIRDQIEFVTGDLADQSSLMEVIKETQPHEVYNLAAQSFVGDSWKQARYTTEVNAMGTLYLLDAIRFFAPEAKFYQASTSEMFGNSSEDGIQNENTPFHPRSPYAISKLYAYWITVNYRESYDMFTSNGILFNHESPIRGIQFVTRKVTDGVAQIKLGKKDSITLGNLDSQRDWGFAGDYVEAMWLMLQQDKPDDFIISTGETHSIKDLLEAAFKHAGIENWEQYVKTDEKYMRPAELHVLQGKSDKAKNVLGWEPKVDFDELIKMMVEADIKRHSNT